MAPIKTVVVLLLIATGCQSAETTSNRPASAPTTPLESGRAHIAETRARQHQAIIDSATPMDCSIYDTHPAFRDAPAWAIEASRMNCQFEEELRSYLLERRHCTEASDCSTVDTRCPFGCGLPVAAASVDEVTKKVRELEARYAAAGARCAYKCKPTTSATCVENTCVDSDPF